MLLAGFEKNKRLETFTEKYVASYVQNEIIYSHSAHESRVINVS